MKTGTGLSAALVFALLIFTFSLAPAAELNSNFSHLPVKGSVTMIDLGAKKCVPCKMMAPILEKLETQYRQKAVIAFIDVWENRRQAQRFGIRGIPTQIFFNPQGKEVLRHVGFMSENAIVEQLKKMGVE